MKKAILCRKLGMTQIFNEDGSLVPVTVLEAGPNVITQIKTLENDGYEAVQVGFVDDKEKVVKKDAQGKKDVAHRHGTNKAEKGHAAKASTAAKRFVREIRGTEMTNLEVGNEVKVDLFAAGEDGTGIALALRWSSPTTALRYARELAAGSNAAARVIGKMRGGEA